MPRGEWVGDAVYATARLFVDECLQRDGSLFTPGRAIWAPEPLDDFYTRFVVNADEGEGSFIGKLEQQLAGASDAAIQLAAEAVFFNYLCEGDTSAEHKEKTVSSILALMREPVTIPAELEQTFASGIATIGLARTQKWQNVAYLLELVRDWKSLDENERSRLPRDHGAFREFAHGVKKHGGATVQLEALLHLVFPEQYEPIVSANVKRKLVASFGDYLDGGEANLDEQIAAIRRNLEDEHGKDFGFYDDDLVAVWGSKAGDPAWLVRGSRAFGANLIPRWLEGGFVSIGHPEEPVVEPETDLDGIIDLLQEYEPEKSRAQLRNGALTTLRFVDRMAPGDLVLTIDPDDRVYVGRVTGELEWVGDDQPGTARRRSVEWLNTGSPAQRADLPERLTRLLRQNTVSDLSAAADAVAALLDGNVDRAEKRDRDTAPQPAGLAALAAELTMDETEIERILALVRRKRQAIFYGPPGTGKTFVGLRLARHLAGDPSRFRLVQFHASYAYEDFVEGYRPTVVEGQPGFRISQGPLRDLAKRAENEPDQQFVLVIDEINRGNVAKVFGELYFLLEYRDEHATLQYSGDEFRLPPNLLLIGTMNTADRTIAILDAALRRRFYFVPFFPGRPPVDDLLRRWLRANKPRLEWVADVVERTNRRLNDSHLAIGHSYFIDPELDEARVHEVWEHAILPTIEEHYFGQPEQLRHFELAHLRSGRAEPVAVDDDEEEEDDDALADAEAP